MQQQPNPEMMKSQLAMQELQTKIQHQKMTLELDAAKLELEKEKLKVQKEEIASKIHIAQLNAATQEEKAHTERISKAADLAIKHSQHQHEKEIDVMEMIEKAHERKEKNEKEKE